MKSKNQKSEKELLEEISEKLDKLDAITKLLSLNLPKDLDQTDKIEILFDAGLDYKTISKILGATPNTVSTILTRLKKRKASTK